MNFKLGLSTAGNLVDLQVSGFGNFQHLKNHSEREAFGYAYLQEAKANKAAMLDFNREKEGTIRKTTPVLPIPNLTYDLYNVSGHGVGGQFRPFRNQIGHVHDPETTSRIGGADLGFDLGIGDSPHTGTDAVITYGQFKVTDWTQYNDLNTFYDYETQPENAAHDFTPLQYKMVGESTTLPSDALNYIGNTDPVHASLRPELTANPFLVNMYVPRDDKLVGPNQTYSNLAPARDGRISTLTNVQPFTNDELGYNGNALGEYKIQYYKRNLNNFDDKYASSPEADDSGEDLDREIRGEDEIGHHHGGYTVQQTNGGRYVYGLPAYNLEKKERIFSVDAFTDECGPIVDISGQMDGPDDYNYRIDGTDKFYHETQTPAYAYAYLLTSVLGQDYVDTDGIPGPSDDDQGYWVKFNYVKTNENYLWRAPFTGANFDRGMA